MENNVCDVLKDVFKSFSMFYRHQLLTLRGISLS